MPVPMASLLGAFFLVGLGAPYVFGRRLAAAWLTYRGRRVVVCPENRELVAVEVDARHAALTASQGRIDLRLDTCTRWPEKLGCGQECLGQIESAPENLPAEEHPRRLVPGQELPARAGDRRARDPRAGVLGLPRRGELQARAPRSRDRPPASARPAAFDGVAPPLRPLCDAR